MPQVSLYLDEETHNAIETRARLSKTSVSKFVATALKSHLSKGWPEGFKDTFGSVSDASFVRQETPDYSADIPREQL